MERRTVPVRTIIGASHNTNPFNQPATHQTQNLDWIIRYTQSLAETHGLKFVPASFLTIKNEAWRVDSY
jgi:hypothetical protein